MTPRCYFSSPEGDILIHGQELDQPFRLSPSESHPLLTLGDYFKAIHHFFVKTACGPIPGPPGEAAGGRACLEDIRDMIIRSEKHGALYHLASVEIRLDHGRAKFAVMTAVSEQSRSWLNREFEILRGLESRLKLPYLPKVYFKGDLNWAARNGTTLLFMALTEWFEDYHEWHLTLDGEGQRQRICIWDQTRGYRIATPEEGFEIFRQAARILTLCYDPRSFSQIYPWHHAGGDFIVRTEGGNVDVRLTTVRNYEPFPAFMEEEEISPWIAMVFFFLNMTVRMRLDKLDGLGEVAWAEEPSVTAAVQGFFEALKIMEGEGRTGLGKVKEFLSLLKAFSEEEIRGLMTPLLDHYRHKDPRRDLAVIEKNMNSHIARLYLVIQKHPLINSSEGVWRAFETDMRREAFSPRPPGRPDSKSPERE
jgi:hypothetical protein